MPTKRTQASSPPPPGDREHSLWSERSSRAERRRKAREASKGSRRSVWPWLVAGGVLTAFAIILATVLTRASTPASGPAPSGVETFDEASRQHVQGTQTYDRVPPAGGNHAPIWLNCGIYDQPVPNENAVHSLEHGSVWVTYAPSLSPADVQTLRDLVKSKYDAAQRYIILSPFPGLPAPVVATAWGNQITLSATDPRLAQFIDHFRAGPQDLEPGGACSGGVGNPIG